MKVAKLFRVRDTRVVETAAPSPQAGEVLVSVTCPLASA